MTNEFWPLDAGEISPESTGAHFQSTAIFMTAFELLIQFLQAYIFTLLASIYIQGALEEGH